MAGQIKVNQVQLGDSAIATQNFVWQTNVDGTCKLARGNIGATTQDILTVDAAGKVSIPMSGKQFPKAWCCFDGTLIGTNTPINGFNVASVTRNSLGDYTLNFAGALANANYVFSGAAIQPASGASQAIVCQKFAAVNTVTALYVAVIYGGSNFVDVGRVYITVFGD